MFLEPEQRRQLRREAERDFERGGRYGYDERRYWGHNDADRFYMREFDEKRRVEEDRQAEAQREQQRAETAAAEQRARAEEQRLAEENEYNQRMEEQRQAEEQSAAEPEPAREEQCVYCLRMVSDWVDPDWARGRVCRECEPKHEPREQDAR